MDGMEKVTAEEAIKAKLPVLLNHDGGLLDTKPDNLKCYPERRITYVPSVPDWYTGDVLNPGIPQAVDAWSGGTRGETEEVFVDELKKLMAANAPLQAALQKAAKAARHADEALEALQVADYAWWKVWKIKKMWTAWKEWTSARDAADETRLEAQLEARLAAEEEARRNHCYIPWITRGTKEK